MVLCWAMAPGRYRGHGSELVARTKAKRLHEIVVCARIEAKHTLLHRIACSQDQNRYAVSSRPQFSQQVQPVTVGKPEVEDCGIVSGVCQRFPRIGAQPHGVHGKLGALQRSFDDFGNPRLIFDDQKTHMLASLESRLAPVASDTSKFKTVLSRSGRRPPVENI